MEESSFQQMMWEQLHIHEKNLSLNLTSERPLSRRQEGHPHA